MDTLDLHAEGLRPNTTFAVFLTEMPVPPFGAVQYIGDFTTNAAGRGSVRVDAIIDEIQTMMKIAFPDPLQPTSMETVRPESRRCLRRIFSLARHSRNLGKK